MRRKLQPEKRDKLPLPSSGRNKPSKNVSNSTVKIDTVNLVFYFLLKVRHQSLLQAQTRHPQEPNRKQLLNWFSVELRSKSLSKKLLITRVSGFTSTDFLLVRMSQLQKVENPLQASLEPSQELPQKNSSQ